MAIEIIKHTYQLRRGTAENWKRANPVLREAEPGFETDTNRLKIGTGFDPWNSLPYIGESGGGTQEILSFVNFSDLPAVGNSNLLYRVIEDKLLYQWANGTYEPLAQEGSLDPSIITLINGGNANG